MTRLKRHVGLSWILGIVFIGLVVYGFQVSRLSPLNHVMGLLLGLVTGTILAGALVWGLNTYAGIWSMVLLRNSVMAPVISEFFQTVMAFTQRLFPRPEPAKEAWWKRSLW